MIHVKFLLFRSNSTLYQRLHALRSLLQGSSKVPISEPESAADYFDMLDTTRIQRHHFQRLEQLGYIVTLAPKEVA